MTHLDGRAHSASGGETYWRAWVPEQPKAVVVFAHGAAEHTGRYAHVAERLNRAGYAVYALDHQGHGKSSGTPGNIGSMAWLIDDFGALRKRAHEAHPTLPLFVMAHSMGTLVALGYLVKKGQQGLAGVVLSGAGLDPTVGSAIERKIAPLISKIAPNLAITDLGANNISRDPAVVSAYLNDPLVYTGKVRARLGAEFLATTPWIIDGLGKLTLPALVLHGGSDKITSPEGSRIVDSGLGSKDKTLKVYDGLFHEIFNEPEQDAVLDDVVSWLDAHL